MSFSLHDIAPRLARARDQLVEDRRREKAERKRRGYLSLRAERLVAHRELQLVRAMSTGNGKYIMARRRKLKAAQRQLARFAESA